MEQEIDITNWPVERLETEKIIERAERIVRGDDKVIAVVRE